MLENVDFSKYPANDREWAVNYLDAQSTRYERLSRLLNKHHEAGWILEVGSYPCQFTKYLECEDYQYVGLDPYVERARELVKEDGLQILKGDIEKAELPIREQSIQTIVFSEVFEHLRIDPLGAVKSLYQVLSEGGTLIMTTPNGYFVGNVARYLIGRGRYDIVEEWKKLDTRNHMGHIHEYTRKQALRVLRETGFEVECTEYTSFGKKSYPSLPNSIVVNTVERFIPPLRKFQIIVAKKR